MYKQTLQPRVFPLLCRASEQYITSHASEGKGKVRHTKRTGRKLVEGRRMMVKPQTNGPTFN
jgi:hypothetical protein